MYKWVLLRRNEQILSCLIDAETDRTLEIHADPAASPALRIGDIATGRIDRIMYGLEGVFIDLPGGQKGYMPAEELETAFFTRRGSAGKYCQGDELLVQVSREAMKTKAAAVTTELSVTDTLVVAGIRRERDPALERDPARERPAAEIRVSKKPDAAARRELRDFGEALAAERPGPGGAGGEERADAQGAPGPALRPWLLLRTEAAAALREGQQDRIRAQAALALGVLEEIIRRAPFLAFGAVHYRSPEPYLRRIGRIPACEIQKIVTDDETLYGELMAFFGQESPSSGSSREAAFCPPIEWYRDSMVSLFNLQSMTRRLEEATDRTVYLRSGGSLIIEHTEALDVIDVNTGKSAGSRKKGADRELELLRLNLEAAREAARQIRLRGMSGIILIDFINMKEQAHEQELMDTLRRLLLADPVETKLVDMTRLGLAELTRRKVERPLRESLGPIRAR